MIAHGVHVHVAFPARRKGWEEREEAEEREKGRNGEAWVTMVEEQEWEESRDRPKRCFAGFGASFRFSFGQRGAGEQAERNEKRNEKHR